MPFFKNSEKQICQVYDNELKPLLNKGWKELTVAEEEAYRALLGAEHNLTSSVSIEEARVKAGLYKALGQAKETVQTAEKSVSTPTVTSTTPKTKTVSKTASTSVAGNTNAAK